MNKLILIFNLFMFNCLLAHNPQSRISLTKSGSLSNHLPTTILTIGHRGFAGKYTENSLQAFEQAVNLGVDGVELVVCDDGVGALNESAAPGLGLVGMRERVEALGGRIEITSPPGRGFEIRAGFPVGGEMP